MVCFRQTQSVISPLIDKIETHFIYQKIPLFHIFLVYNRLLCVTQIVIEKNILKAAFQKFNINFLNSDFSVANSLNVTKSLGDVLCNVLEGIVSQNFDLGLSYFFMLCIKFVKLFFHYFSRFMT